MGISKYSKMLVDNIRLHAVISNVGQLSAVLAQHTSRICYWGGLMLAYVILYWPIILPLFYIKTVHTPIYYFIILDCVSHGELIPLHLPSKDCA